MQGIDIGKNCLISIPNESSSICGQCRYQAECNKFKQKQKQLMGKSHGILTPHQVFNLITDFYYK